MIKLNKVALKDKQITINDINFEKLMIVYAFALEKIKNKVVQLKEELNNQEGYNLIINVSSRIKSPDSIINKMIKKGYSLTYESLIKNINDIAGLRVVCVSEKDVYRIVKKICRIEEINIIKKKDYIKKPKESGYSAYHIILEVPIYLENKKVWIKVEVQIRTMAMDFWANIEHEIRYKTSSKISKKDSKLLKVYAKIIGLINKKMIKMYMKNYKCIENQY